MFPLIKVEIIVAIFIVAVKFVLPKSRKVNFEGHGIFPSPFGGSVENMLATNIYLFVYIYIFMSHVSCLMSHVFSSVRYPHNGGALEPTPQQQAHAVLEDMHAGRAHRRVVTTYIHYQIGDPPMTVGLKFENPLNTLQTTELNVSFCETTHWVLSFGETTQ
jgi:hypothetical protein